MSHRRPIDSRSELMRGPRHGRIPRAQARPGIRERQFCCVEGPELKSSTPERAERLFEYLNISSSIEYLRLLGIS